MDEFPGLFGGPAFLDDAACTVCNALCAVWVLDPDPNPLCDNCSFQAWVWLDGPDSEAQKALTPPPKRETLTPQ